MTTESFFLLGARPLIEDTPPYRLHQLIDWAVIGAQLKGLYRRELTRGGGPEPYAPLSMFKLMLLGQWHGLSDAELERALKVRIDFMVFCGFDPSAGEMPDASTICRFRNRLVQAKLDQRLLCSINRQLEAIGVKVQGSTGAIVDATIIESAARPRVTIEVSEEEPQMTTSADAHARWVKKGKQSYHGYRGYATTDTEDGYVQHVEVHPANEAEVNKLPQIIEAHIAATGTTPDGLFAENERSEFCQNERSEFRYKGYASAANRQYLRERGITDFIQHKATRGHPLDAVLKALNRLIGTVRYKVEQCFGTMKRRFHLDRAATSGGRRCRRRCAGQRSASTCSKLTANSCACRHRGPVRPRESRSGRKAQQSPARGGRDRENNAQAAQKRGIEATETRGSCASAGLCSGLC
ncbi:IS5 family transposase [Tepidimonas taiwanensis]|uniref:IS5 family transposase n=1 Tax=Tepidimonas taiwanensis TaxID=307486 RepID=UPI001F1E7A54|nr:IS5 family transposase [Tepidimonas taiwanensis]